MAPSFPPPVIPDELWDKIFTFAGHVSQAFDVAPRRSQEHIHLDLRKSLKTKLAIVRVSRKWNRVAMPHLYRAIIVKDKRSFARILKTLTTNENVALKTIARRAIRFDFAFLTSEDAMNSFSETMDILKALPGLRFFVVLQNSPLLSKSRKPLDRFDIYFLLTSLPTSTKFRLIHIGSARPEYHGEVTSSLGFTQLSELVTLSICPTDGFPSGFGTHLLHGVQYLNAPMAYLRDLTTEPDEALPLKKLAINGHVETEDSQAFGTVLKKLGLHLSHLDISNLGCQDPQVNETEWQLTTSHVGKICSEAVAHCPRLEELVIPIDFAWLPVPPVPRITFKFRIVWPASMQAQWLEALGHMFRIHAEDPNVTIVGDVGSGDLAVVRDVCAEVEAIRDIASDLFDIGKMWFEDDEDRIFSGLKERR